MGRIVRYRIEDADRYRDDPVLPDGTPAQALRVGQLYNVLLALGIDVHPSMGKQELIASYEAALIAAAEAKARASYEKWEGPNQSALRRAAAEFNR